jgi:uncharacterized protein
MRAWPTPPTPWRWSQRWLDLAFFHWPIDEAQLRPHVPPQLELDLFDGRAWISAVPFRMAGVRPRLLPPVPGISSFTELNLRTYVTRDGKPGVFFFALIAGTRPVAWLSRRLSGLGYRYAPMTWTRAAADVHLTVAGDDDFDATYEIPSAAAPARAGTLEHFLVERYCLYHVRGDGSVQRGEVDHPPWTIAPAKFSLRRAGLVERLLPNAGPPALAHATAGVAVHAWPFTAA